MSDTPSNPAAADASPTRWTRMHIMLHWLAVGLIALQFLSGESMSAAFDADMRAGDGDAGATPSFLAPLHMAIGLTVFLAVVARLRDRFVNGRPPHPSGEPRWAQRLAAATQTLLYATVLAMPIAGAIAWFGDVEAVGTLHALASKLLLALIVLHVAGALANHYWFKTDVLRKMLPGQARAEAPAPGVDTGGRRQAATRRTDR